TFSPSPGRRNSGGSAQAEPGCSPRSDDADLPRAATPRNSTIGFRWPWLSGNLETLNLIADMRRGFVILLRNRFSQVAVEILDLLLALDRLQQPRRHFPLVRRPLVHSLEQRLQALRKGLVTGGATEPPGLLEIRLTKAAHRALLHTAASLHF